MTDADVIIGYGAMMQSLDEENWHYCYWQLDLNIKIRLHKQREAEAKPEAKPEKDCNDAGFKVPKKIKSLLLKPRVIKLCHFSSNYRSNY